MQVGWAGGQRGDVDRRGVVRHMLERREQRVERMRQDVEQLRREAARARALRDQPDGAEGEMAVDSRHDVERGKASQQGDVRRIT